MDKNISIIYTYYNQREMLKMLFEYYDKFLPKELLKNIEFVIVDDCSQEHPAIDYFPLTKNINYSIWRTDKKEYNVGGARNLGVKKATHDYIVSLDIDMILTNELLIEIFDCNISSDQYYRFFIENILSIDLSSNKRYYKKLNSPFFIKKETYLMYSSDEDFCGNYGYEDEYWKDVLSHNQIGSYFFTRGIITSPIRLVGYEKFDTPKNNPGYTKGLDRINDLIITRALYEKKKEDLNKSPRPFYVKMKLDFNYELVKVVNV